ncbi:MAG: hypothetical protein AAF543_10605 [Pseudomonadota bacterium]
MEPGIFEDFSDILLTPKIKGERITIEAEEHSHAVVANAYGCKAEGSPKFF